MKIKKTGQDYKIFVAITRADLLLEQNEKLAGICQKTLSWDGKRYTKLVHKNGFNLKEFNKKQMAIKEYLSQDCPDFYNTIRRYIGEDKLVYGLLASHRLLFGGGDNGGVQPGDGGRRDRADGLAHAVPRVAVLRNGGAAGHDLGIAAHQPLGVDAAFQFQQIRIAVQVVKILE